MNSNNDLLKMALSRMEGTFSPVTLSAWFDDAEAISLDGTRFVLRAANQFKKEIIESRFTGPLEQSLTELLRRTHYAVRYLRRTFHVSRKNRRIYWTFSR